MKENIHNKQIIDQFNDLSLFPVSEEDAKYFSIPKIKTHIAEYLCSDELADIIDALDGSLRLLKERSFPSDLNKFFKYAERFLEVMREYQQKEIPFPDRISAEVKLLTSLHGDPRFLNYGNPSVEKMFQCLIGNFDTTGWILQAPPDNLIREVRRFSWNSLDNSLNELVLECKRIIFHSFTLIGFVTIEMNSLFLHAIFPGDLEREIAPGYCFAINAFMALRKTRLQLVLNDQRDCIGELWLDGLDVEIGRFFQYACSLLNTYGVATSSSLLLENGDFMFAVTPREFDALEKHYNNHVTKLHRSYRKLQTEIMKLLNEYASRQEELEMPGTSAGPRARILSGFVEICDSLRDLQSLINDAVTSNPLNCESFKPMDQKINNLIEKTREASPNCFFRQTEFKLPKDTIDSSFTSSSRGSSCSSSSSSLSSRSSSSGMFKNSRKRKLDTLSRGSSCSSSSSSLSSSSIFKDSHKRKLVTLKKFQALGHRIKINTFLGQIKAHQKDLGEKFVLSSENQFISLESYKNYVKDHRDRVYGDTHDTIERIENRYKDFKISSDASPTPKAQ